MAPLPPNPDPPSPAADTSTRPSFEAAVERLEAHFGYPMFRAPQERVVRSVLEGADTLGVLPTGAGKSVCFQIPAMVLPGVTIVLSPLLALMQDQVAAAVRRGIPARSLTSLQSREEQARIRAELRDGGVKLLYAAPERWRRLTDELAAAGVVTSLLAIDEAHCIAEWGADFRPSYLAVGRFRRAIGNPPAVALTGSATPAVRQMIIRVAGLGRTGRPLRVHLASFDRRNLRFEVVPVTDDRHRLTSLLALLHRGSRRAIVYAATRNLVEALARVLRERGFLAVAYHAGLTRERRAGVLADFLADRVEVVVATCAFGMGIDKPDVRMVIHWTMPPTPEAYYQEAGRAGRDGLPSRCVLLYAPGDGRLARAELDVTFPARALLESAWRDADVCRKLPRHVAASAERLRREVGPEPDEAAWARIERRRREALWRIVAVERYAAGPRCRRAFLLGYFGERVPRCSGCDRCPVPRGRAISSPA